LASGWDFFAELPPGGVEGNLKLLKEAWGDSAIREQVEERRASRQQGPSFAELVFSEGRSVRDARRTEGDCDD
jgi:hypothetical protein